MNLQAPDAFRYNERCSITAGSRWPKWLKAFENYLLASNITDKAQKKAVLLHVVGEPVVEIYETLAKADDDYEAVKKVLSVQFDATKNVDFQIFKFMSMRQSDTESITDYVIRLNVAVKLCEFEPDDVELEVRRQLIFGANEASRIQKIAFGKKLTLRELINEAKIGAERKACVASANDIKRHGVVNGSESDGNINVISQKKTGRKCFKCGNDYPHDNECPAKSRRCNKCNKLGHFAKFCSEATPKQRQPVKNYLNYVISIAMYIFHIC